MLTQRIKITYSDDREFVAEVGPAEFVAFERHFSKPGQPVAVGDLARHQKYEWILYLAWLGAKRAHAKGEHPGDFKPSFDTFLDVVSDFDVLEDPDPLDVTTS